MKIILPKIIGHRGLRDLAPENTFASIKKAFDYRFKWIEVDVKISKDNIPFLLHDDLLNRTTSGKGFPYNFTYNEILKLDAGSWFDKKYQNEYPPKLEEVLKYCFEKKICLNIELKPNKGKEKENVIAISNLINQFRPKFQYYFSSFDYLSLKLMRRYMPGSGLGYLLDNSNYKKDFNSIIRKCINLKCFSIGFNKNFINKNIIKLCKKNNLAITVFSKRNIKYKSALKLWENGVDSIFLDNPNYYEKILD
tara:strand:- start:2182 stop:2934 length:753 start_codon:yes stop_codon:yes gene_type:complete